VSGLKIWGAASSVLIERHGGARNSRLCLAGSLVVSDLRRALACVSCRVINDSTVVKTARDELSAEYGLAKHRDFRR
jgi:hypothetical protein